MPFTYQFCCVDVERKDVDELTRMIDEARDVSYRTFRRRVPAVAKLAAEMGYESHPAKGLTIKDDWMVHYAKSTWYGKPCYFLTHSAIEYVFLEETHAVPKVPEGYHAATCNTRRSSRIVSQCGITPHSLLPPS